MDTTQLKRIADAIEEILRLVKKDMEPRTKKKAASPKLQASSLTVTEGQYRIQLERNKYGQRIYR